MNNVHSVVELMLARIKSHPEKLTSRDERGRFAGGKKK